MVRTVARRRICGKVKLIPGLCLRVRAFARLKRWMTDEFLLFEPNNEAKPLGRAVRWESPYSKLVITTHSGKRERDEKHRCGFNCSVKFGVIMRLSLRACENNQGTCQDSKLNDS